MFWEIAEVETIQLCFMSPQDADFPSNTDRAPKAACQGQTLQFGDAQAQALFFLFYFIFFLYVSSCDLIFML